jgi:hypothetical protein
VYVPRLPPLGRELRGPIVPHRIESIAFSSGYLDESVQTQSLSMVQEELTQQQARRDYLLLLCLLLLYFLPQYNWSVNRVCTGDAFDSESDGPEVAEEDPDSFGRPHVPPNHPTLVRSTSSLVCFAVAVAANEPNRSLRTLLQCFPFDRGKVFFGSRSSQIQFDRPVLL